MATNGKKTKLKEPVKVRTKKLADGSESYYLDIYVDGKRQYEFLKLDHSQSISVSEAASLALALSLDGAAAGFGAAMGNISIPAVVIASLAANQISLLLGSWLGEKLSRRLSMSLGWLGGVILILLAFSKL